MYFSYFVASTRAHLWKDGWYIEYGLLGLDGHEAKKWNSFMEKLKLSFIYLKEEEDILVLSWKHTRDYNKPSIHDHVLEWGLRSKVSGVFLCGKPRLL